MKRTSLLSRRSPLKAGRKVAEWASARRKLKKIFEAAGRTRCERCGADDRLSFAHRFKRRKITTDAELKTVALLCIPCHDAVEGLSPEGMKAAIDRLIAART